MIVTVNIVTFSQSPRNRAHQALDYTLCGAGMVIGFSPPRRKMKNIRECSGLGRNIWGEYAFSTNMRHSGVLCSGLD
jgi:hypothetical protein